MKNLGNFRNRIGYGQRANQNFANFGGQSFNNFNANADIPSYDRTLTFKVTNTDTANTAVATLFNAAADLTDSSLATDITISVAESSHAQVKTSLLASPFTVLGAKYVVETATQFSYAWTLNYSSDTGETRSANIQPLNYKNAQNNQDKQVDMGDLSFLVNKDMKLTFTMLAGEEVTIIFYIKDKVDIANAMSGAPVVKTAYAPLSTGVQWIDRKNF